MADEEEGVNDPGFWNDPYNPRIIKVAAAFYLVLAAVVLLFFVLSVA